MPKGWIETHSPRITAALSNTLNQPTGVASSLDDSVHRPFPNARRPVGQQLHFQAQGGGATRRIDAHRPPRGIVGVALGPGRQHLVRQVISIAFRHSVCGSRSIAMRLQRTSRITIVSSRVLAFIVSQVIVRTSLRPVEPVTLTLRSPPTYLPESKAPDFAPT